MRKIWNHYDPLDFHEADEERSYSQETGPVPVPAPHKKRLTQRLQDWLFRAEEEEGVQMMTEMSASATQPMPAMPSTRREDRAYREQVQRALEDWKKATAYFESVSDPELVDYAVYGMEAAKKRYIYLLRNAGHNMDG